MNHCRGPQTGVDGNYLLAIHGFSNKVPRSPQVFKVLKSVLDVKPEEETYEALLSGYVAAQDAGKIDEVLAILRDQFQVVAPGLPHPGARS